MAIRAAALGLLLSLGVAAGAAAQTPGPTLTPAPAPQPAIFGGSVWVDAHRVGDRDVTAKIGDTVCAHQRAPLVWPPPQSAPIYGVAVPSEEVVPGCGREGVLVTFFVGDQQAAQTVEWHAGEDMRVDLTLGRPFAHFTGLGNLSPREEVVPYLGNLRCGYGSANDPGDAYEAIVYSAEQQPGCGVNGSVVTFRLLDAQGNVVAVANEKGTWHAWDGVSDPQRLDLTFGPATVITMPGTGTGGASSGEAAVWGRLSVLLAFVSLASAALGFAPRRRATTR